MTDYAGNFFNKFERLINYWEDDLAILLLRLVENELHSAKTGMPASSKYAESFSTIAASISGLLEVSSRMMAENYQQQQFAKMNQLRSEYEDDLIIDNTQQVSLKSVDNQIWDSVKSQRDLSRESIADIDINWTSDELKIFLLTFMQALNGCEVLPTDQSLTTFIDIYLEGHGLHYYNMKTVVKLTSNILDLLQSMTSQSTQTPISARTELAFFVMDSGHAWDPRGVSRQLVDFLCNKEETVEKFFPR